MAGVSETNYINKVGLAFWTANISYGNSSDHNTSGYPDYTYNQGTGTPKEQMRLSNKGFLNKTQYPIAPLHVSGYGNNYTSYNAAYLYYSGVTNSGYNESFTRSYSDI